MNRWQRLFQFELRMMFRNPWLLALPLLFGLLLFWNLGKVTGPYGGFYDDAYTLLALMNTLSLGLVMLLGVLTVRRDVRRAAYEWSAALPVSYAARISAKYLAGLLYFTPFTVLAGAAFAWASARTGVAPGVTWEYTAFFTISYEVSYIVTLALAMLLAVCIGNRVVYLIAFCAWMFGTFFMDLFLLSRSGLFYLSVFHLSRLFLTGDMSAEAWGIHLISDELTASRWFVLAFALLLLVACVLILNQLRPTKRRWASWMAGGLALLLAAGAFVPYGLIWKERYAQYEAKVHDPSVKTEDQFRDEKSADFRISSYDIDLKRETNDRLQIQLRLKIPAGQLDEGARELPLTLNRAFNIKRVKVNGTEVSFAHRGEALTVHLKEAPKSALEVELEYSGKVEDYVPTDFTQGAFYAFVKGENVLLPEFIAWYPLAGHRSVYLKEEFNRSKLQLATDYLNWDRRRFPPAEVHLHVSGFKTPLYANLTETGRDGDEQTFASKDVTDIRLLGGNFIELSHPGVPVNMITVPYKERLAGELLEKWADMHAYFTSWVERYQPKLDTVQYFWIDDPHTPTSERKNDRTYYMYWMNGEPEADAVSLMDNMLLGTMAGDAWLGQTSEDVRQQIRSLMWYLYYREHKGYSEEELKTGAPGNRLYYLFNNPHENDPDGLALRMVREVGRAFDEGKQKQVKQVLNYFYDKGLEIEPPETETAPLQNRIPYEEWEREWKKVMGE